MSIEMLKRTERLLIAVMLILSLIFTPVFVPNVSAATGDVEKKADSWRYEEGQIDEDADRTVYRDSDGELQTGTESIGGGTIAWSKIGKNFYNNKGDVILGATRKGIDVSRWQKTIDWNKVKNSSDVDFVIIRCGFGNDRKKYDDSKWFENVKACEKYGIPYGVYLYSYADSVADAKSEARHTLRLLKGYNPAYPVFYDLEDRVVRKQGRTNIIKFAHTYCSMIEDAGYDAGIYASLSWFRKYLNDSSLDRYTKWVAQWNSTCTYEGAFRLWQCTSNGSVPGIRGRVDINFDFAQFGKTPAQEDIYKVITTENLNYRTGPGTKYKRKGTYKKGTVLVIKAKTSTGWGKLSNGNYVYLKYTKKLDSVITAGTQGYKAKTTGRVNYRKGPGTNYAKAGTYNKGKTVTILSKTNNGWGRMSNGYYISLRWTKKLTSGGSSYSNSYKVQTTENLNYRTGPGTDYTKKGTYKKGTTLTVVSTTKGWGKLSNGYYVYLKYTKKK